MTQQCINLQTHVQPIDMNETGRETVKDTVFVSYQCPRCGRRATEAKKPDELEPFDIFGIFTGAVVTDDDPGS